MLLKPGWSRSWQMHEVSKMNVSRSPSFDGKSKHQMMPYICRTSQTLDHPTLTPLTRVSLRD